MFLPGKNRQLNTGHSLFSGLSFSFMAFPEYQVGGIWYDMTQSLKAIRLFHATNAPRDSGRSLTGKIGRAHV